MIMEKMNIAEILRNCKRGTKLYSPLFGDCELEYIDGKNHIKVYLLPDDKEDEELDYLIFYPDGTYLGRGECMLFPSNENRDWSTFKVNKPKFDPKTLQPFDKVLANNIDGWVCDIFSHPRYDEFILSGGCAYGQVIPYNEDTKHLVGTRNEAPEFYRYWE